MRKPALITISVAVVASVLFVLGAGAASTAPSWTGVVVAKDPARKAIVTASPQGVARTLRVASLARFRVGQRVSVRAARLADGTFRSYRAVVSGRAMKTKLRGVIVRHQRALRRYLVSAGGSVLAVRAAAVRRTAAASADSGPKPGDEVVLSVSLGNETLTATTVQTVGHTDSLELEGIFLGLDPDGKIRLAVAQRGEVLVSVPAGTQLPSLQPGAELELDVTVDAAGAFTLTGALPGTDDSDSADDTPSTDDDDDSVDTPSVDTPSVDDDESVDTPSVDDDESVDTPSVDDDSSVDDVDDGSDD